MEDKKLRREKVEDRIVDTGKPAIKLLSTPRWERSHSVEGHKPKWGIRCWHCAFRVRNPWGAIKWIWYYLTARWRVEGMPMAIRHGTAAYASPGEGVNVLAYKCPRCAWFIQFFIVDEVEYIDEIIDKHRGGSYRFVPLCDDWSDENEEIGRQLEAMGYWGGRGNLEE